MRERHNVRAQLKENWLTLIHTPTGEVLEEFLVKPAESQHRSFIISTWVKSYQGTARKHGFQGFYEQHEPSIAEARWQDCLVATDETCFTIYAWVCGKNGRLYHAYTIPELRKFGVATGLIERATGGLTEYARPWPYKPHARLNPYLLGDKT